MDAFVEMLVGMGQLTLIFLFSGFVVAIGYLFKQALFPKK